MQPNYQPFAARRQSLARQLKPGVVILPTSPEVARNADAHFPFRFDSSFYYLTAFLEPEAVFVQIILDDKVENLLFCRAKNEEREIWDGYRYGPALRATSGLVGRMTTPGLSWRASAWRRAAKGW